MSRRSNEIARTELQVMHALKTPQEQCDLIDKLGLSKRRMTHVIYQLRKAKLIRRVQGTHRYCLEDV
jgi:DNA-binding MarR family transcriptional regulator